MDDIRRAADGSMSDDEIMEMLEEFDAVSRATAEQRPWANVQQELFGHAERLAKQAREEVLIKRRNQSADARKKASRDAFAENFAKDPAKAPAAKSVGSLGFVEGGKASASRQGTALGRFWKGSLVNALDKEGLLRIARKGSLDEKIVVELDQLGRKKGKPGASGSKEAATIAKIISRLNSAVVGRLNRSGAYIKQMPGYIIRQTHDQRLIKRAGFENWFAAISPKIDEFRTFNRFLANDERRDLYLGIYNELAAGRHPSAAVGDYIPTGANLAKKLSAHRELHFKSGQDFFAYHQKFGRGTILENVERSLDNNGRAAALLGEFGSKPEETFKNWVREQDDKAVRLGAKTSEHRNRLSADSQWRIMSGEGSRPADGMLARLANGLRAWQVSSKMGSAVISAYTTDPVLHFNELSRHGVPFARKMLQPLISQFRMIGKPELRQLANHLQAFNDGASAQIFKYDTGDGTPGIMSGMARLAIKLSALNWWDHVSRSGITATIAHQMHENTKLPFEQLAPNYRRMIEAYGITAKDWPRIATAATEINGQSYITPHQLKLEAFGNLDTAAGRRAARRDLDELQTKVIAFIDDRMAAAVNEPGARTRAMLLGDSQAGTWSGEARRAIALFRSYPVEMLTRVWGERVAHSEYATLAAFVATMSVAGMASVLARDALKGLYYDFENMTPGQAAQLFARGMVAGGGASLLGDFVMGEYSRYGQTFISTQAGPVLGQLDTAFKIYGAIKNGDDAGATALRAVYTNLPLINVWWARTAFDYLFLYQMQEAINPGYLARMERNKEKESGQKYILSPSAVHG
jgi:hypothetical protein